MNLTATRPSAVMTMHPDPLVRAGIVASLQRHTTFDAFEQDADAVSPDERPVDVVIVDHHQAMQMRDAAERPARRSVAGARILCLTANDRETDIRRAIEAGIDGYVVLGGPVSELIEGVTALARGSRYLGRSVAHRMADSLTRTSLTSREIEVLRLVVCGECNKAIARRLEIGLGTVKTHMNAVFGKLHATSRTQAAAIAVSRGIVEDRQAA